MQPALPNDPLDAALRISAALEAAGISCALGGALAYGLWAVPRATVDVDVNIFVGDAELEAVFDALASLGIPIDRAHARAQNAGADDDRVRAWDRIVAQRPETAS